MDLNDLYFKLCKRLATCESKTGSKIGLRDQLYKNIDPQMDDHDRVDQCIYFDKQDKLDYIEETYWTKFKLGYFSFKEGSTKNFIQVEKENGCVAAQFFPDKNHLTVDFRTVGFCPTMYLDFLVIDKITSDFDMDNLSLFFHMICPGFSFDLVWLTPILGWDLYEDKNKYSDLVYDNIVRKVHRIKNETSSFDQFNRLKKRFNEIYPNKYNDIKK